MIAITESPGSVGLPQPAAIPCQRTMPLAIKAPINLACNRISGSWSDSSFEQRVDVQFCGDLIPKRFATLSVAPHVVAAQTEERFPGDDEMAAIIAPARALHGDHSLAPGCLTSRILSRRYSPARFGQSIEAPRGMPMRAAPIGVRTEIRCNSLPASLG